MTTDAFTERNSLKFSGCKMDNVLMFWYVYEILNNVIFLKTILALLSFCMCLVTILNNYKTVTCGSEDFLSIPKQYMCVIYDILP